MKVVVIGAGFAGVAMAVNLQRAGFDNFTIYEKDPGPGGTWWANTYPGAEVDVNSFLYSFSFHQYDWSRSHAGWKEIQEYFQHTIDRFGLRDRIHFSTPVEEIVWSEEDQRYDLTLAGGKRVHADVVVGAVGLISTPRYPEWPGLDSFGGIAFHPAVWEHDKDLSGKRVAIVGTGSTACQLVPALAPHVERIDSYQREPAWILPKGERDFTPEDRKRNRSRMVFQRERYKEFKNFAKFLGLFVNGSEMQAELEQVARDFIDTEVKNPVTREHVTPKYPFGCKRLVLASTFYAALNRDNVELIPHAVERVTKTGVVAADGVERECDVLIMATGFQATNFLAGIRMVGRGGRELHEVWGDDPQAVLGSTVPGFTNFFMLNGPNTNGGGSIVYQVERQAEMVTRALRRLRRHGGGVLDTRPEIYRRYNRWIVEQIATKMSASHPDFCNNYYFTSTGRNATQWPRSPLYWNLVNHVLPPVAFRIDAGRES